MKLINGVFWMSISEAEARRIKTPLSCPLCDMGHVPTMHCLPPVMIKGEKYNWKNQEERLVYLGNNLSGNGYWHQFALVESPDKVGCEVKDYQLDQFERTVT